MSGSAPVFGPVPRPFAASQTSCLPSGVTSASVGYAAVGMRPITSNGLAFGR